MTDNLKLWNEVCKTNPSHTKKVTFGRTFTAIDAHYQIMTATEAWGPMGVSWGVDDEKFELLNNDLVLYQAFLFYPNGKVPIHSSALVTKKVKGETTPDDDCIKKVATDALTKGLSKLGFNADVFLGKFDDNKYVAQMSKEFNNGPSSGNNSQSNSGDMEIPKCPKCGKPDAVIKSKEEYGGGWVCFKKKDGCGAKWDEKTPSESNEETIKKDFNALTHIRKLKTKLKDDPAYYKLLKDSFQVEKSDELNEEDIRDFYILLQKEIQIECPNMANGAQVNLHYCENNCATRDGCPAL